MTVLHRSLWIQAWLFTTISFQHKANNASANIAFVVLIVMVYSHSRWDKIKECYSMKKQVTGPAIKNYCQISWHLAVSTTFQLTDQDNLTSK
jgi:hypothetical protein